MNMNRLNHLLAAILLGGTLALPAQAALAAGQQSFATPEAAMEAFGNAVIDSDEAALQAMFGGQAPSSASESAMVGRAGSAPDAGIRSTAGDPGTTVVNKGGNTRDLLSAPESTSTEAAASVPK